YKVVPIMDPGVKSEPGYKIYDDGIKRNIFCRNPEGIPYIGHVWPGETVFPDFSLAHVKQWWADKIKKFAAQGLYGFWLDMNDPATGFIDNTQMLFNKGREPHSAYHNQYALGMAMATRRGMLAAHADTRPFLLSRSACTGSSAYTAVWTGDNFSNYYHLKLAVATTLNLALSGIPFNGPDIGGFGHDANSSLMQDWVKACFLFPFFRNHSQSSSCRQEPWRFDKKTLEVVRRFIRLRYSLRPYLYNLFIEQELTGEAVIRPLFYDFKEQKPGRLSHIDDQFMIGPGLMQAPFLEEGDSARKVFLPSAEWFDLFEGKWIKGPAERKAVKNSGTTPLYIRSGTILPVSLVSSNEVAYNGQKVSMHIFCNKNTRKKHRYVYHFDDGISFAYKQGKRSSLEFIVRVKSTTLFIDYKYLQEGYGRADFDFFIYSRFKKILLNGKVVAAREQASSLAAGVKAYYIR
ncbi:MAG TPA: glycoside hydrolase family 31 protein, partial [Spirochaetota bacterium]|nr:glycoside hydrolase family 31 protein [Spirochaetota bacterium]